MISHIRGKIIYKDEKSIVLDVNGIGYKVFLTMDALNTAREGAEGASFWTHLVVKEEELSLYGFRDRRELGVFEKLITVSGIGPKSALGILGAASSETIEHAVAAQNTDYLTNASGVSKKNAEKIVLELKGKLAPADDGATLPDIKGESDTVQALKALGYSEREVREALKEVGKDVEGTEARIKEALKVLGR